MKKYNILASNYPKDLSGNKFVLEEENLIHRKHKENQK
jgi:hypothetical protein